MRKNIEWYGTKEENIEKLLNTLRKCGGCPSIGEAELIETYAHNVGILLKAEKRNKNK